jgi:hypothetical protein
MTWPQTPRVRQTLVQSGVLGPDLYRLAVLCIAAPGAVGVETIDSQAGAYIPLAVGHFYEARVPARVYGTIVPARVHTCCGRAEWCFTAPHELVFFSETKISFQLLISTGCPLVQEFGGGEHGRVGLHWCLVGSLDDRGPER